MTEYVKEISATGLYQRLDFHQQFQAGVNILYGRNGAGKTTLLHILSNILNGDYERFLYLNFENITLTISNGSVVHLSKQADENRQRRILLNIVGKDLQLTHILKEEDSDRRLARNIQHRAFYRAVDTWVVGGAEIEPPVALPALLPAAYFPAFRTMMEAWTTSIEQEKVKLTADELAAKATGFARRLFGPFVPKINYPSALDIEQRLGGEIRSATFAVARYDEELLAESFVQMFTALRKRPDSPMPAPEQILDEIRALYEQSSETSLAGVRQSVYARLQTLLGTLKFTDTPEFTAVRILEVFRDALSKRAKIQQESFEVVNTYINSVNEFLEGKNIDKIFTARRNEPNVVLQFDDGRSSSLRALSSGERQIVTLIYAATHMNEQQVVLIDEPELSLHVDWQRKLLTRMSSQLGNRQIIACTHSPVVGADYEDRRTEINLNKADPTSDTSGQPQIS